MMKNDNGESAVNLMKIDGYFQNNLKIKINNGGNEEIVT